MIVAISFASAVILHRPSKLCLQSGARPLYQREAVGRALVVFQRARGHYQFVICRREQLVPDYRPQRKPTSCGKPLALPALVQEWEVCDCPPLSRLIW